MTSSNDRNAPIIDEFRRNGGRIGGIFEGSPVLLLSTTGAKSGQRRVNPMMYLADGDRLLVFASRVGAPTSPDWYHNLVANPGVRVEVGDETYEAEATVLAGEERDRLYAQQAALYPVFIEYEQKTTRKIPVVALTRKA